MIDTEISRDVLGGIGLGVSSWYLAVGLVTLI